jgi:serine protease AprX
MRRTLSLALALAGAGLGVAVPGPVAAARSVVVTSPAGATDAAAAVSRAGGSVVARLPLAGGVVARLRPGAALPAGYVVAEDRTLRVAGLSASTEGASTVRSTLGLAATGREGAGVTVAVVDTGIAEVPDLAGTVAEHVDVTGTGGGDPYGHGTFMAGLIAGNGASSNGRYTGVAPGARLVDVKVAGADGTTSLSLVLRGLEAVAARRSVRVLNLSLSSGSPLPYQLDPLTRALDALWRRGVTVVVPAGNDGPDAGTIASPGVDPNLLTVSAVDENGTGSRADDTVPEWSSRGPALQNVAKPDLAAPGSHVVSLRAPGSTVDAANPSARVEDAYFRGSGTSMATAVASGAAAALLAARPGLTPDQVKGTFMGSAYAAPGLSSADAAGAGGLDLDAAYSEPARGARRPAGAGDEATFAEFAAAWAMGDFEAVARAWAALSPAARAWAARAWAAAVWERANSWSDEEWQARAWSARAWAGSAWMGASWTIEEWLARAWAARAWVDVDWAARAWAARAWAARAWAGASWTGDEFAARAWAGRAWAGADWAGRAWADDEWAGRAWAADGWAARAWSGRAWSGRAWSGASWLGASWLGASWLGRAWTARGWASAEWGW